MFTKKRKKKKREHFNRSIDIRYSVIAFNMSLSYS